jgi:triphosphatase
LGTHTVQPLEQEMELEAKYAILGPLNPATLAALDLGPYQLHPDGETHHQDVVLDTPGRAITSGGHSLRLRHADRQVCVTYKGPNHGSNGHGVREREEIEAPLPSGVGYDLRRWPHAIVDRIGPLVGEAPLAPLVKLYIHRRTWLVLREGRVIGEMALDQGIISAGGRTARVHELEVELKADGTRAELDDLGQRLLGRLPLQPQPRGKLQRGFALLDLHRALDGHTPLEAVGRHAIRKQLRRLRLSEPAARAGIDPEGVHVMRTATRRLRTTLQILEESPVFRPRQLRRFRHGLRRLARSLGDARDLDVLLHRVEEYAAQHPEQDADLPLLRRTLVRRRREAQRRLLRCLDSRRVDALLARLDVFTGDHADVPEWRPRLFVRHFAGGAIWRRYEAVLSYETVAHDAPAPLLHRLRIACKRLRYALEIFERELGKGAQPLIGAIVKVQDHLGALQDAVVALDLVTSLHKTHPDELGLRRYADALAEERDRLLATFPAIWNDLSDAGFGQELAELIAGL